MDQPSYFVYKLIPPRPTFDTDMTDGERAIMAEHGTYWRGLMTHGNVLIFGPVSAPSGPWGLAVLTADNEQEVRDLAARDPAVSSAMATFEIGTMPVATVRT